MNELTINEIESVNGGVAFYARWSAAPAQVSAVAIEFKNVTVFAGGGVHDDDEQACFPD